MNYLSSLSRSFSSISSTMTRPESPSSQISLNSKSSILYSDSEDDLVDSASDIDTTISNLSAAYILQNESNALDADFMGGINTFVNTLKGLNERTISPLQPSQKNSLNPLIEKTHQKISDRLQMLEAKIRKFEFQQLFFTQLMQGNDSLAWSFAVNDTRYGVRYRFDEVTKAVEVRRIKLGLKADSSISAMPVKEDSPLLNRMKVCAVQFAILKELVIVTDRVLACVQDKKIAHSSIKDQGAELRAEKLKYEELIQEIAAQPTPPSAEFNYYTKKIAHRMEEISKLLAKRPSINELTAEATSQNASNEEVGQLKAFIENLVGTKELIKIENEYEETLTDRNQRLSLLASAKDKLARLGQQRQIAEGIFTKLSEKLTREVSSHRKTMGDLNACLTKIATCKLELIGEPAKTEQAPVQKESSFALFSYVSDAFSKVVSPK